MTLVFVGANGASPTRACCLKIESEQSETPRYSRRNACTGLKPASGGGTATIPAALSAAAAFAGSFDHGSRD